MKYQPIDFFFYLFSVACNFYFRILICKWLVCCLTGFYQPNRVMMMNIKPCAIFRCKLKPLLETSIAHYFTIKGCRGSVLT